MVANPWRNTIGFRGFFSTDAAWTAITERTAPRCLTLVVAVVAPVTRGIHHRLTLRM
jgi:hypothetical protein